MSGRQENDDNYKRLTKNLLEGKSKILYAYYSDIETVKTATTVFQYIAKLKSFFDYLEEDGEVTYERLAKLKPVDINLFLNWYKTCGKKEKSDGTMAFIFNVLNSFFSFLKINEYIEKNPCDKLKAQKVRIEKSPTILTEDEVRMIADYILNADGNFYANNKYEKAYRTRDYLMFMIACRTGLRISAICAIDIDDIDFTNNCVTVVEKEKETRQVFFGNSTKKLIEEWISVREDMPGANQTNALFINRQSKRFSVIGAREMYMRYLSIITYKHLTPHKLRATCATRLWEETADLYLVATVLGHKNVNTTRRYTGVDAKRKKAAADTLDSLF